MKKSPVPSKSWIRILPLVAMSVGAVSARAADSCPQMRLPQQFIEDQKLLAWTTKFELIDASDRVFGSIEKEMFTLNSTFTLRNADGQTVAIAKKRILSAGSVTDVYDCRDRKIGIIQEDILSSLFNPYTSYNIEDVDGRSLGTSTKVEFFGTDFSIQDHSGANVMSMSRPALNWLGDVWSVTRSSTTIDSRLVVMIPAMKSDADARAKSE